MVRPSQGAWAGLWIFNRHLLSASKLLGPGFLTVVGPWPGAFTRAVLCDDDGGECDGDEDGDDGSNPCSTACRISSRGIAYIPFVGMSESSEWHASNCSGLGGELTFGSSAAHVRIGNANIREACNLEKHNLQHFAFFVIFESTAEQIFKNMHSFVAAKESPMALP